MALHRFLITAESLALGRFPEPAAFDIEKQIHLPRPKGIAMHGAAQQFLDQTIELRQHGVAVWKGIVHTKPPMYPTLLQASQLTRASQRPIAPICLRISSRSAASGSSVR